MLQMRFVRGWGWGTWVVCRLAAWLHLISIFIELNAGALCCQSPCAACYASLWFAFCFGLWIVGFGPPVLWHSQAFGRPVVMVDRNEQLAAVSKPHPPSSMHVTACTVNLCLYPWLGLPCPAAATGTGAKCLRGAWVPPPPQVLGPPRSRPLCLAVSRAHQALHHHAHRPHQRAALHLRHPAALACL